MNFFAVRSIPPFLADLDDPESRLHVAWELAQSVGAFLLHERPSELTVLTKSSGSDLVSAMDKEAERRIVEAIRSRYPSDGVLGEEGANVESKNGIRWIIDPLDGTVNYLFGIPIWGVSIAIEVDGVARYGVISIPPQNQLFVGVKDHGAYRCDVDANGETDSTPLSVRPTLELSKSIVMTGFGYDAQRRSRQAELLRSLISEIADIRRGGAAVVDFCWLASGFSDAYYEYGLNPWDFAAGALIASEAGAIIGGLDSDDFTEFMIAATPPVFEELRILLQKCGAELVLER